MRVRSVSEAGSIEPLHPVTLNLQHDPERRIATTGDGTLRLHDTPDALTIEADLREGSAELALVRRGALRGLSVEFFAIAERREAEVRVLTRAGLPRHRPRGHRLARHHPRTSPRRRNPRP